MNRINRRRFVAVTSVAATSAILVACGNDQPNAETLNPTQIPDVAGAPPTLAPITNAPGGSATTPETGGGESGSTGGGSLTIEAHDDFSFSPNEPNVAPGQTITVVNKGFMQHDLVSDELGIGTELLNGGDTAEITIPDNAEVGKSFEFHCTVPGHAQSGMVGKFNIVEAGQEDGGGEQPATEEATAAEEGTEETAVGGGDVVTIETRDNFSFEPNDVDVAPGQTIKVTNAGFMQHDLVSKDLGIGTELLNNGNSQEITIPADAKVGESYKFICTVAGHEQSGMVGQFNIVETGAAAPAEEPATEETTEEAATAESAAGGDELTIETLDSFKFEPNDVDVYPGQVITVTNAGFMQHDLVSKDLGIGTELLNTSQSEQITIPADAKVGESYKFICTVAGHEQSGMVGQFNIVEAGAAAPAEEPATEEATEEAATAEAAGGGDELTIETLDSFKFEPNDVDVYPGQVITVTNAGFMQHDLVSKDLGIGTELLNTSQSEQITIPADAKVGESYKFICTVAGHEQSGMVGQFNIVEGGGSGTTSTEGTAEAAASPQATPETEKDPMKVTVVGTKWEFSPAEFEVAPGGVITFQNDTDMSMGLSAEPWDKNALTPMIKSVAPGKTGEFTVPKDAKIGDVVDFKSNLSEAEKQGMVGKITIVAPDATPSAGGAGGGQVIEIHMLDSFAYDPKDIEASVGDTLHFVNKGFMQHDAAVDDWGKEPITPMLGPGGEFDYVITDVAESGKEYEFYCTVPGHKQSGMKGTIKIK